MADLEHLIREGFARGLAGHGPSERWPEMTAALDAGPAPSARRHFRSPGRVVAASLTLGALLALVYPPVRAAVVDGLHALVASTASTEGHVYHGAFTALEEASAIAGFIPPTIPDGPGRMGKFFVMTDKKSPEHEIRSVSFSYYYDRHAYTVRAEVGFVRDESGRMVPQPPPAVDTFTRRAEMMGVNVQTVDLGDAEAVCFTRGRRGRMQSYCQWLRGEMTIEMRGPDLGRVIELARLVKLD